MPNPPLSRRQYAYAALCLVLLIALMYAAMCFAGGVDPFAYFHNSYLLQAQAWLRGETALNQNHEFLELAPYNGKYYVSFPPVPSIPMVLFALIWGDAVPGSLIQKIYATLACLAVLSEIRRTKRMHIGGCAAWAFLFCFGSAMLPISLVGGVWFEAQILAFLFSTCAITILRRGKPTPACIFYALSVGCRPFAVLLGPVLLAMYTEDARRRKTGFHRAFMRLLPGLLVGLAIAAAYGWYNYIRFGSPFEFGHNYLPEFTGSRHGQFSIHYIADNWKTLFFGPPFSIVNGRLITNEFGFSMFLSCPILVCGLVWLVSDIIRCRITPAKIIILLMGSLNVLLLLMHRTLGGHQFGARYALELLPLCLCWYLLSPGRKQMSLWEFTLLIFGLAFNFFGGCLVHI